VGFIPNSKNNQKISSKLTRHAFNTSKINKVQSHTFVFGACGIISTTMHGKFHTKINKMIILIFSQIGTNDTQHTYTHTHTHPHIHIKSHTIIFIYTHTKLMSHK
jgi:hypothetical protein